VQTRIPQPDCTPAPGETRFALSCQITHHGAIALAVFYVEADWYQAGQAVCNIESRFDRSMTLGLSQSTAVSPSVEAIE
jgi:hypothetical protein